ncbi:hypothetical protein DFH08DRAFT_813198 [Mycena albidolilacea]|uniref:Uncharacterized protein n=1 Tax=Mycena albidolilacea TaxID=1033008 RepID=A0AAD6ZS99_9AGAR|nr:hypothetical protein DFH08DRAFT_813198 [Mycena albidolilacea]
MTLWIFSDSEQFCTTSRAMYPTPELGVEEGKRMLVGVVLSIGLQPCRKIMDTLAITVTYRQEIGTSPTYDTATLHGHADGICMATQHISEKDRVKEHTSALSGHRKSPSRKFPKHFNMPNEAVGSEQAFLQSGAPNYLGERLAANSWKKGMCWRSNISSNSEQKLSNTHFSLNIHFGKVTRDRVKRMKEISGMIASDVGDMCEGRKVF